jgi:hypothetical protein
MNRIPKVALCIGLAGLSVLAGTPFATAKAPLPPSAPVVVTFLSGDVIATPQALPGPFTATIDFLKYIPYIFFPPAGGDAVLRFLQTKNPITYDSLRISVNLNKPLYTRLDFRVTIDGVPYDVIMNAFLSGWTESTPTLDTIHLREGRFAVQSGNTILVVAGTPARQVNLDFSMTK